MQYLLGIDFGGGASKATLLDTTGRIVAESSAEYPTLYPFVGACEQDCGHWWKALQKNVRDILCKSGIRAEDILCIALDSATHTAVLCDGDFAPLRPAIHWTDSRSTAQSDALQANYGDRIFEICLHAPGTIWTLPQLMWVKENEPEIFEKIRHIFFEKDYLRYLLTGTWYTDYIEAQGSMLYDCRENRWSEELTDILGLDISVLPPVIAPTDTAGFVTEQAARETGLAQGTRVICGTTDTCMEVFASGAVSKGDATVKLATAGRICIITDQPYPHRNLVNYRHVVPGLWYPGTGTKSAAASYRWYRDTFGENYETLNAGAEQVPIGCEGMVFHPYLNGELTPYADPLLCGSFTGIRATHTKAHFTRAVLEGVCYSLLDCKLALAEIGIPLNKTATLIGGGAKGALWRQMTADVLGVPLQITENNDSSFGSAMLAGIAAGVFQDPADAAKKCVKPLSITYPIEENTLKYQAVFARYKRIHDALAPVYHSR